MNIDEILKIEDNNQKIVVLHQFCNQHHKNWTETEKLINAILDMESEVMNGGFHQYFLNSAGDQWQDVSIGLDKIGAIRTKELFKKSLTIFINSQPPIVWEERQKIVNNLSQEQIAYLDILDQDFYKYEDNIQLLTIAYAEKQRNDFGE